PHVARFFRKLTTWTRQPRRRTRMLWLEPLEGRDAPAALASAILNAGVLTVSGLDAAFAADSNQTLSFSGTGAGAVDLSAGSNTQFKGTTETTLSFSGVTSNVLDMRA